MEAQWPEFKALIDEKELSIQYITIGDNYLLKAIDGFFDTECMIPLDPTHPYTAEFEADYKSLGNLNPKAEVFTQSEIPNKTLKIVSVTANCNTGTGVTTLSLKVPGTPGSGDGRWIYGADLFFNTLVIGDMITEIKFTDDDNLLGGGAGATILTNTETTSGGWYFPLVSGVLSFQALNGPRFVPSGFYAKITAQRTYNVLGVYSGTLYANVKWATST